jgi:hypothetical protein
VLHASGITALAMALLEPEPQRQPGYHARITDGELERVAEDAVSLTDVARDALKEEITRRGLTIELRNSLVGQDEARAAGNGYDS